MTCDIKEVITMKRKSIECNERMEVTKFFGFFVKEGAIGQKNFFDLSEDKYGSFDLFIAGDFVASIDWYNHFFGKSDVTENEIWAWMLKECRKYTKGPKIFIEKSYVESLYSPLANSFIASNDACS